MTKKPTYEELEQRVKELEKEVVERKQADEEVLLHTEIVENMAEGAYLIRTSDGVIVYANKTFERMFGYDPGELVNKHVSIVNTPSEKSPEEIANDIIQSLKEKGTWSGEVHNIKKDGTQFWCHANVSTFDHHDFDEVWVSVHENIDERKKAEEELRKHQEHLEELLEERTVKLAEANEHLKQEIEERKLTEEALKDSEERYRMLFNNVEDAVYVYHPKARNLVGKIIEVNDAACQRYGYTREEFLGLTALDLAAPEEIDEVAGRVERLFAEEDILFETVHVAKDGRKIATEIHSHLFEFKEKPTILSIVRDVTERKLAEEEQEKLQAQLQRAQTMETIGTLAGGVAHDLNNILSGIVTYPELLLLEIPEDSPLRNAILTIQKSGEKAVAVVQDLLTLARRGVAVTEVVKLNLIISEYVKSPEHEKLISFHPGVQVRTNLEADVLNILGSPAHLSKTVMNLVSNAAEAMSEGGTISISTENRYIDRPIRGYDSIEEGDYVILTVSDTGVGILPTDMERIFEPFYTKKVMGRSGTGLGMAVVWGTVKDHKGYIDIESTEGKGTTFTLYFPVTRKELAKDKPLLSIEDYMGKGESILVVDDVKEQREIATKILKKLDYSVSTVSSGEEAVDYLKDNSADLLILDMIMDPGIDGLETYKRIIELHPGQKAIITSGFSETKRVKEAQKLGAGAYVKKPFLLEKIGLAIRAELDK